MRLQMPTIVAGVLLALLQTTLAHADAAALWRIFNDYEDWQLREFPEYAMSRGDYRFADRLTDHSLAANAARSAKVREFLSRVEEVPRDDLSADDQLNYDLFAWMLREKVESDRFHTYLMPIGPRDGIHQDVPQMSERVRFETLEDYRNYGARLSLVPSRIEQIIELLKQGVTLGMMPPAVSLAGIGNQIAVLVDGEGLSELAGPFEKAESVIGSADAASLRTQFDKQWLPGIRDALRELKNFLEREYLPRCPSSIAASDLPNGSEYYAHQLRRFTTTDLSPQQIHELGLSEVKRIRAEMMSAIRRTDFVENHDVSAWSDDELFERFIDYLRTDPRFYHKTAEELLTGYRDICKQIDGWMPRFFHKLPRLPYGVRKIPDFMAPSQTTAYYSQGDIRNAEPGYFYANCYALDQRPKYEMRALAIHEAVPGHHHQVALAQELEGLPEFRKSLWVTAFGEGWALYSERLGMEVNFYADPYDDFGRLTYEMWRACRLVVDPGMHALGWSREQAVDFMRKNTALSHVNIDAEVDRYIAWPGQATAYKIGELRMRALRAEAEKTLGADLDLRAFHDVVLSAGSIPLDVLERRVRAWISGGGKQVAFRP